jgi:thiol-disulfide isomerase/thioredoxin
MPKIDIDIPYRFDNQNQDFIININTFIQNKKEDFDYDDKKRIFINKWEHINIENMENQTDNKVAELMLFHVDWCPHCKTAKPEWEKFAKLYDGKEKGDYIIKCLDYNCTDENADVTKIINKYNIESYPTVKMLKDGQIIEFDSKITEYTLEQFVNTMV